MLDRDFLDDLPWAPSKGVITGTEEEVGEITTSLLKNDAEETDTTAEEATHEADEIHTLSSRQRTFRHTILTQEEELDLLIRAKYSAADRPGEPGPWGIEARDQLLLHNQKLVFSQACRFQIAAADSGFDLDDLISHGNLGLIRAIEKYDPERMGPSGKPIRLSTYAIPWIRQHVRRALQTDGRRIRIPVHLQKEFAICFRNYVSVTQDKRNNPEWDVDIYDEVARRVQDLLPKYTARKVHDLFMRMWRVGTSNFTDLSCDSGDSGGELSGDERVEMALLHEGRIALDPEDHIADVRRTSALLTEILNLLPANQREVVMRRYGLGGGESETLEEIGDSMNLTRERIRQIQVMALRRLKGIMRSQGMSFSDFALEDA